MALNLTQAAADYIMNWEGHNDLEAFSAAKLIEIIKKSTRQEIQDEFNRISAQHLWSQSLADIFYEELLNRIMEDPTFSFSTNWFDLTAWLEMPFMTLQIGFDDYYPYVDRNGVLISVSKTDLKTFAINSDSFALFFHRAIVQMILRTHAFGLKARIQVDPSRANLTDHDQTGQGQTVQVIALMNEDDPEDYLNFLNNGRLGGRDIQDWSDSPTAVTLDIPLQAAETLDFLILRRMINHLQDETYGIVDLDLEALYKEQDRAEKKLGQQEARQQVVDVLGKSAVERLELEEQLDFGLSEEEIDDFEE